MKPLKTPMCTVCASKLMRTPKGWVCPTDGFYFIVRRGQVIGKPLLNPPGGIVEAQPEMEPKGESATEETFEEWLEEHGVTDDMYKSLDNPTKWELKMSYSQRHKKDADFVMLPPQK